MAKKRKLEAAARRRLDEADRAIYSTFRGAANSLSLMYTQAMGQQMDTFRAGEHHALEKLHQLVMRCDESSIVTVADIVAYLQNETDRGDASVTPNSELLYQHSHPTIQSTHENIQNSPCRTGSAAVDNVDQICQYDQTKSPCFRSALSSPLESSPLPCHLFQGVTYSDGCVVEANETSTGS